jgi:hypothetical protein
MQKTVIGRQRLMPGRLVKRLTRLLLVHTVMDPLVDLRCTSQGLSWRPIDANRRPSALQLGLLTSESEQRHEDFRPVQGPPG